MMSMFQCCSSFSLSLIALTAGMALVVFMKIHKEHTTVFCRGIAYLIVILAILAVICAGYCTVKSCFYGQQGCAKMMQNMNNMSSMPMMQNAQQMMNQGTMMPQKTQPMQNREMNDQHHPASQKVQ